MSAIRSERAALVLLDAGPPVGLVVAALLEQGGHKDASVTLRIYADLFDSDLDAVAVTLHNSYSRGDVGKVWTKPELGAAQHS